MKRFSKTVVRTLGFTCCWLAASNADAATPRAYVSVNGNDANTCNVPTTPCRTYTGAISQTTPGGTVVVMDSGTFGGGTIAQAVTINAPAGVVALAATPIIVNPGSGNTVVLRGLTFQAAAPGTGTGITHQTGQLFVENVVVGGWMDGLLSSSTEKLFVKGSVFRNNANRGLGVLPGSTPVAIDESFFEANDTGIRFDGGTGRVSNTVVGGSSFGGVVSSGAEVTFQRCEVAGNSVGLGVYGTGLMRVSLSTLTRNTDTGLVNSSATLESFGNNIVRGNAVNTFGAITSVTFQ